MMRKAQVKKLGEKRGREGPCPIHHNGRGLNCFQRATFLIGHDLPILLLDDSSGSVVLYRPFGRPQCVIVPFWHSFCVSS